MWWSKCLITFIVLVITSCNFRPVYSNNSDYGICKLEGIQIIGNNTEKSNNIIRAINEHLSSCREAGEGRKYKLSIDINESLVGVIFLRTGEATRKSVTLTAYITITDVNGNVVYSDKVENVDSYNTIESPYNEYVADKSSYKNNTNTLANKIITRLIRFIESNYENTGQSN